MIQIVSAFFIKNYIFRSVVQFFKFFFKEVFSLASSLLTSGTYGEPNLWKILKWDMEEDMANMSGWLHTKVCKEL